MLKFYKPGKGLDRWVLRLPPGPEGRDNAPGPEISQASLLGFAFAPDPGGEKRIAPDPGGEKRIAPDPGGGDAHCPRPRRGETHDVANFISADFVEIS